VSRWEPSDLATDFWPCPAEAAEEALVTLSRVPHIAEWGYVAETSRLWWTLTDDADRDCKHLAIKSRVQRSISEHRALDWEG
jgi:hypothetical protein